MLINKCTARISSVFERVGPVLEQQIAAQVQTITSQQQQEQQQSSSQLSYQFSEEKDSQEEVYAVELQQHRHETHKHQVQQPSPSLISIPDQDDSIEEKRHIQMEKQKQLPYEQHKANLDPKCLTYYQPDNSSNRKDTQGDAERKIVLAQSLGQSVVAIAANVEQSTYPSGILPKHADSDSFVDSSVGVDWKQSVDSAQLREKLLYQHLKTVSSGGTECDEKFDLGEKYSNSNTTTESSHVRIEDR
jgi:hypothetical protein